MNGFLCVGKKEIGDDQIKYGGLVSNQKACAISFLWKCVLGKGRVGRFVSVFGRAVHVFERNVSVLVRGERDFSHSLNVFHFRMIGERRKMLILILNDG